MAPKITVMNHSGYGCLNHDSIVYGVLCSTTISFDVAKLFSLFI